MIDAVLYLMSTNQRELMLIAIIVIILVLIGFGTISQNQVEGISIALLAAPFAIIGAFIGLCSLVIGMMLAYWFITIPLAFIIFF